MPGPGYRRLWRGTIGLGAALLAAACATASQSFVNTQIVTQTARIDRALRADDLSTALTLAQTYERRVPGADSQGLLGRVLWRTGAFVQAEGLFRRAASAGDPEGRLGLARVAASLGRWHEAVALLVPLVQLGDVAPRAHRLLAAISLANGDRAAAAEHLRRAGQARSRDRHGVLDRAAAALLAQDPEDAGWTGTETRLLLQVSEQRGWLVPVQVNGTGARFRVRLDAPESLISERWITGSGARVEGPVISANLELASSLQYRGAVMRVGEVRGADGVLGFDLLSEAVWRIESSEPALTISPPATVQYGSTLAHPPLRNTHWLHVRLVRDGLGVQLFGLPRIDARVVIAGLDPTGTTAVDARLAAQWLPAGETPPAGPVPRELRFGAWRGIVSAVTVDLSAWAKGGYVAPRAVLGAEALGHWNLRFDPATRQLALSPSVQ